jgi:hypothetical protein
MFGIFVSYVGDRVVFSHAKFFSDSSLGRLLFFSEASSIVSIFFSEAALAEMFDIICCHDFRSL